MEEELRILEETARDDSRARCVASHHRRVPDSEVNDPGNVDLMQTSVNDHWHCIWSHSIFWRLTDKTTPDGYIDLEFGHDVPVGHIWKFDPDMEVEP